MIIYQKRLTQLTCLLFLLGASTSSLASPINDAVRFWGFDGDYTDSKNGATTTQIGGVTFGTDRDGNAGAALSLDGYNDAVRIDQSSDMGALGSFSLSMWFQLDTSDNRSYLFDTRAPGSSGNDGALIFMDPNGGESTKLFGYAIPGSSLSTTADIFDMDWHLVSLVRDISTSSMQLYLDGALVGSRTSINTGLTNMNDGLVIGSYGLASAGGAYWTDGSIDDVAIWDRALNASEVTQLYTQSASATSVPAPSSIPLFLIGLLSVLRSKKYFV